jgi:hypothetical protein
MDGSSVWSAGSLLRARAMHASIERHREFSVLAGDPIENLCGSYGFLRLMGIQGPGDRAPALFDDLLGKLARFGFILEFTGRANQPALAVVALRRDI